MPPVTKQFFIASDQSSLKFIILVSGKLLWDLLFPQSETKTSYRQRAVADFHKMAEKRFAEVNENEKDWLNC